MNSYKELIVWQKSLTLAKEIYNITESFPKSELYGLTNQMRRAAVSIPSNIAEGFSRKSVKENCQFISVSFGSSSELETQLILSKELGFTKDKDIIKAEGLLLEVRKMLNSLLSKLKLSSSG